MARQKRAKVTTAIVQRAREWTTEVLYSEKKYSRMEG